ncbi:alpha/beta fold hydrolase [Actinokineospora bangkokensis]|uniref:Alpha/beta hydrolase n=1 Tax=Actinokineospora bangkokensis TaxID=1193682 RepID=A0A1Q9LFG2_9PSEU|nr:alpha/beta hydrolase [Actinokineospora bangkokensis]OLR90763.1 alpha/beta hydrolase [Actinokineospora bangkokensis]
MRFTEVTGAGGVRLAVREAGDPARPTIAFVHGWAQSGEVWAHQLRDLAADFHLLAVDLRGHGRSAVPADGYGDTRVWADDLAAVLALAGGPATVVGWSYGGLVITDYLRHHGCAALSGIVLVGALTEIGRGRPGGATGPVMRAALPDVLSEDADVAVPAVLALTRGMTAGPAPDVQARVAATLAVPPAVRRALFTRDVGSGDVLADTRVPVVVAHGTEDAVVAPAAAEYALGKIPGASARWFPGVGHLPFAERADAFTRTVAALAGGRKE